MDEFTWVQPPGCAGWLEDGCWPTEEEASHPLFDLSDPDNLCKLARAIACRNNMSDAGALSGELAYAYQHEGYDVACIKEVLLGRHQSDLEEVLAALADLNADKNHVAQLLTSAVQELLNTENYSGLSGSEVAESGPE